MMLDRAAALLERPGVQVGVALVATLLVASTWLLVPLEPVPIAAVLALAAVAIAIASPFAIGLIFISLSFFRIHEAYPVLFPLRLPLAFAGLTVVALAWHMLAARTVKPFWTPPLVVFGIFFVLVTLGIAFAVNRPLALSYWTSTYWKIAAMTLAVAWLPRTERDFLQAAVAFLLSGIAIGLVAIYNGHMGIDLVELTRVTIGQSIESLLADPNDLALVLLFPLGFAAALAVYPTGKPLRLLGALTMAVILYAIILTQSRGGLLGVLAVFAVFGLRLSQSRMLLGAGAVAAAFVGYYAMDIAGRVSGGAAEHGLDASAEGRLDAWVAAINMAVARPLSGVGLFNFSDSIYFYASNFPGRDLTAHSTWFGVLGETGIVGFAVFMTLFILTGRAALNSVRRLEAVGARPAIQAVALGLLSSYVGFGVAGSFLSQGFTWPFYILLGLTVAMSRFAAEITGSMSPPAGTADERPP
jgi:putative inorganic carbon (hco3(-)) transporter